MLKKRDYIIPPLTDNTWEEYVEIHNPLATTVTLEETNGAWRLDGGVSFLFPAGTKLAAGETLLVVNFDPADTSALSQFETAYQLSPGTVRLFGPYGGKLGNRSDRVALHVRDHDHHAE